jgi:serine/threonine protein kinase
VSSAASHELPRAFGPYELVRRLGVGGMAEVYVARARSVAGFEKVVALKTIHARFSEDPEFTQLLVEEANITAQLSHRNIVQVIDLGVVDETHFIAMELVDGIDLSRLLTVARERRMRISPRVAAYVCREVCDGLEHAHRKAGPDGKPLRIVHRDVSPPNILVSHSGEVKITDFGIAKASLRAVKTGTGVVKGKYAYMAPEQARALAIDHRADLFALGCVLYELATGRPVYPDAALPILLDRVARVVFEPPERARPELPGPLVEIIAKALQPSPDARYATARAMGEALTELLFSMPPNPELELASLVAAVVGRGTTASVPPISGASLLDDAFDDATQIESVSVMRSRMVPGAPPKAGPPKAIEPASFRDESTRSFKRVDDRPPPPPLNEDEDEDETSAVRIPPGALAPPKVPSLDGMSAPAARVRSPGAASRSLAPPPPPPPDRNAPTVAPSARPRAPSAGAPVVAPPRLADRGMKPTPSRPMPVVATSAPWPPDASKDLPAGPRAPEPAGGPSERPSMAPFIASITPIAARPAVDDPLAASAVAIPPPPPVPAFGPPLAPLAPPSPFTPPPVSPLPSAPAPDSPSSAGLWIAGVFAFLGIATLIAVILVSR